MDDTWLEDEELEPRYCEECGEELGQYVYAEDETVCDNCS